MGLRVSAEVIAGAVGDGQDDKFAVVVVWVAGSGLGCQGAELVEGGAQGFCQRRWQAQKLSMVRQRKGGAGADGAYGAFAHKQLALVGQGLQLHFGAALHLLGGFVRIRAGLVCISQRHGLVMCGIGFDAGAGAAHLAVVPTGGVQGGGGHAAQAVPLGQAVFFEGHAALGEADVSLRVGFECAVVVCQDQGVAAQRGAVAGVAGVVKPGKQALFGPQALQEVPIAFVELGAQRAFGIDRWVCQFPAPLGLQGALCGVVGKHGFGDVDHAHVLEDVGIVAVRQEGGPRLDGQAVAGIAAIAA